MHTAKTVNPSQQRLTEQYEQQALAAFRAWYRSEQPTLSGAALHAGVIAKQIVEEARLIPTTALLLLYEHREWANLPCQGNTVMEIVKGHLTRHLEENLQQRGLHVPNGLISREK